jgi:hypothetical protein
MVFINARVELKHGMTKDQLIKEMAGIPGNAVINPGVTKGDRPWESDQYRLGFQWSGLKDSNDGPHSRACGISPHFHGPSCATDCPTCYAPRVAQRDTQINELNSGDYLDAGPESR